MMKSKEEISNRIDNFAIEVIKIHEKHNESYSMEEAYDMISLFEKNHEIAVCWSCTRVLSKFRWEDGDSGLLLDTLKEKLDIKSYLLAIVALADNFDTLDELLWEVVINPSSRIYEPYLENMEKAEIYEFWSDVIEVFNPRDILESVVEIAKYKDSP